jgi:hypothetical protein
LSREHVESIEVEVSDGTGGEFEEENWAGPTCGAPFMVSYLIAEVAIRTDCRDVKYETDFNQLKQQNRRRQDGQHETIPRQDRVEQ